MLETAMNARFTFVAVASLLVCTTSCKLPYMHPPGLELGDQYHLVFVTSGTRNAQSANIGDYNSFVQMQAEASVLPLPSTTWKAIASTQGTSAKANSSSIAELFDGTSLQAPIDTTQDGNVIASLNFAWTGTAPGGVSSDNPLGSAEPERGDLRATDGQLWLTANNSELSSVGQPLYAISGPITVTSINPVPDLWALLQSLLTPHSF